MFRTKSEDVNEGSPSRPKGKMEGMNLNYSLKNLF